MNEDGENYSKLHSDVSVGSISSCTIAAGMQLSGHGPFKNGCRGKELHFYSVMTNTGDLGAGFYCGFAFPVNFLLCG